MVICTKVLELNEFHFGILNFLVPKHDIGGTSYKELEMLTGKWAL